MTYVLGGLALVFAAVAVWQALRASRASDARSEALRDLAAVQVQHNAIVASREALASTLAGERVARAEDAERHAAGMRRVREELARMDAALRAKESGGEALGRLGRG